MNYYVGSFKDPAARIVVKNDKVYRLIYQRGEEQLQLLRNSELISYFQYLDQDKHKHLLLMQNKISKLKLLCS